MPFSDFTKVFLSSRFLLLLLLLGPEIVIKIHSQQVESVAVGECATSSQSTLNGTEPYTTGMIFQTQREPPTCT